LYVSTCFLFNTPPPTELYTLSLHDALPISPRQFPANSGWSFRVALLKVSALRGYYHPPSEPALHVLARVDTLHPPEQNDMRPVPDRKSTRLYSSHDQISYAVFCLKKKKNIK